MNLNTSDNNKDAFIQRLIEVGWSRQEAEKEWNNIQEDEEGQI